jgi:hypothetical protein
MCASRLEGNCKFRPHVYKFGFTSETSGEQFCRFHCLLVFGLKFKFQILQTETG